MRFIGAGESELRGPEAVWELEKRPPDPKEEGASAPALENSISTGAEGPAINPELPPRFNVIGCRGSTEPISISESPPLEGPAGLKENCFVEESAVGRPEFASIFNPRESLGSDKSIMLPIDPRSVMRLISGPGPIRRATDSIS